MTTKKTWFDGVNLVLMLLLIVITLYPLYYMGIVSISSGGAVSRGEVLWLPKGINLQAYKYVFDDPAVLRSYGNTILYTALGTLISLVLTTLCAYPLSRNHFYGRAIFSLFVIFTMFFDGGLIPRFMVVHGLGMVDTIWALVIPTAISVFNMILMRTFFEQIPEALHESATVDGAGEYRTLLQIVLPLSMPVMATMFLFYAVGQWNSFFPALIYLNEKELYPLQIILRNIVIQGDMASQTTQMGADMATMSATIKYAVVYVAILPVLCIYPFVQKYFVQGAMLGSVKG
ncbi:sugar ABC transporter permease [Cohnella sp. CIP 111063]|jgi:putative aldouronate transport system permease protein|uniref:carbohydrate ABC transporter permease n=1 Tax=unclassified Cohnella TaxID=2636738 RepID=UPI000B8BBC0B|nr:MULTISPECIES: carbohydrate ABC transporter permease [unclassified Cohnella]OXS54735.1 sugar ABC transporter permease [Cohnella sp. CIP 111063]PRX64572.1 carbohydrate ABC transporter membrane protein 2 (CUT1 family) [Cohnella sp. SGD-V74]